MTDLVKVVYRGERATYHAQTGTELHPGENLLLPDVAAVMLRCGLVQEPPQESSLEEPEDDPAPQEKPVAHRGERARQRARRDEQAD